MVRDFLRDDLLFLRDASRFDLDRDLDFEIFFLVRFLECLDLLALALRVLLFLLLARLTADRLILDVPTTEANTVVEPVR